MTSPAQNISAVAVYCASTLGNQAAYQRAALSLGKALAASKRPLVYGGGSKGLMGIVSGAVLEGGGEVTGVVPIAMVAAGGEGDKGEEKVEPYSQDVNVALNEKGREKIETIVVNSMHERKVKMAELVGGFIGCPGGLGTFEEVLEATTWTQLGIHSKPVVLLNVLSFYDGLRNLIRGSIDAGFIGRHHEQLVVFVDGPPMPDPVSSPENVEDLSSEWVKAQEDFDWGTAALEAFEGWTSEGHKPYPFDWTRRVDGEASGTKAEVALGAT